MLRVWMVADGGVGGALSGSRPRFWCGRLPVSPRVRVHDIALGSRAGRPARPPHDSFRGARGQPSRRSCRPSVVGVRPAGLRRRSRGAVPDGVRHPGLHRLPHHVGQPHRLSPAVSRDGRRALRQPAGPTLHRGVRGRLDGCTGGRSSWTRRGPGSTTPTCARTWWVGWTRTTGPWPARSTEASRASRAGASAP